MSVDLTPHSQLGFPRPLTELVTRPLLVSNPNKVPVNIKIKTTAPKAYCVKPNAARIEPGQKLEIQVLLQPMQAEPPLNAKCRDKFLVQSAPVPPQLSTLSYADFWPELEKLDKASIREQKIRVAYLPPQSAAVPEEPEDESIAGARNGAPPKPLTPAQLQAENEKLRTQLAAKGPAVPIPVVALLLAVVAAAAASGTWFAIAHELIKL